MFRSMNKLFSNPGVKIGLKLIEKVRLTDNTYMFKFSIPKDHCLGLPIGNHLRVHRMFDGEEESRAYTPITLDSDTQYVAFAIRIYRKNENPDFADGGLMSQYLESVQLGEEVMFSGPHGRITYRGGGKFCVDGEADRQGNNVTMIAGGTGITPLFQIVRHVVQSGDDKTKLRLIYANQTEKDIMLRNELEQLQVALDPGQLQVYHVLGKASTEWTQGSGRIDEKIIMQHGWPAADGTLALLCGRPAISEIMEDLLIDCGYSPKNILRF